MQVAERAVDATAEEGCELGETRTYARQNTSQLTGDSPLFFAHPIELTFYNLGAKSEAHIRLQAGGKWKWGNGVPGSQLVGVSVLSSPRDSLLAVNSFLINYRNVSIFTNAVCLEIHARLYVHTLEPSFAGRVDLPPGATVTIESPVDRTTLAEHGLSSFSLTLR